MLVGKPGVGKTFLLQDLLGEDWGLSDDAWGITDLEEAVRDMSPRRVVLDDAHLRPIGLRFFDACAWTWARTSTSLRCPGPDSRPK